MRKRLKYLRPSWSPHGADYLEFYHAALIGQPGDQTQSARVYQRNVLFDQPDLLC